MKKVSELSLKELIKDALIKDRGPLGDVTSLATIEQSKKVMANFIVKANIGVISGLEVAKLVFSVVDPELNFKKVKKDGDEVKRGDVVATVEGKAISILAGERIALEFLRRMSGIATKTRKFVEISEGAKILDTRKVLPGYGELDKKAVRDGGGVNHRLNLSEMGLIKNNHIDLLGGDIRKAIKAFRNKYPEIPLEVEVRDEIELQMALENNPDRIMLDNMGDEQIRKSVKRRDIYASKTGKKIDLEASGNMNIDRVKGVCKTGVEYISVGELTHSVEAFDLSLHIN